MNGPREVIVDGEIRLPDDAGTFRDATVSTRTETATSRAVSTT
jgi:hypothetical protein